MADWKNMLEMLEIEAYWKLKINQQTELMLLVNYNTN